MPSQYEPCGLSQLYALRYGTVPVVHRTGGLADTIVDTQPSTTRDGTATGFQFEPFCVESLETTLARSVCNYLEKPSLWRQLVETGMRQDWSWARSAGLYEKLYGQVVARIEAGRQLV